ncbi:FecCD family ABC transporter permease [Halomonas litopenaei]|uniref:FecCD family ABC transporter permease n=1 Tax=Halomonas litopenaei TaxID=2109328 RepID=UPI003FA06D2B
MEIKTRPLAPGRTCHPRPTGVYLLLAALAASILVSVVIGARPTDLTALMGLLDGRIDSIDEAAIASRLPRTLLALLAGAALAVAGATMQGLTRNPLADPGLLGVNAGAALAVVIGIAWFDMQQASRYIWVAISGAGASALLVYLVANLGRGGATPLRLALSGAVVTAALTSLTSAVILPRADIAGLLHSWLIGGVGGATLDRIKPVLPFLALGLVASLLAARKLNLMALGDEAATGLGERVALARALAALGAILLCGATTAACGPIGFVGLVVPHALRLLVGADYRRLLPLCALGGALLVILADTLGRVLVRPAELDVGIVTALLGGPVFIWIVRRHTLRSL